MWDECGWCGLSVVGTQGEHAGCGVSVRGMAKCAWGMKRVCMVWGVSVHGRVNTWSME